MTTTLQPCQSFQMNVTVIGSSNILGAFTKAFQVQPDFVNLSTLPPGLNGETTVLGQYVGSTPFAVPSVMSDGGSNSVNVLTVTPGAIGSGDPNNHCISIKGFSAGTTPTPKTGSTLSKKVASMSTGKKVAFVAAGTGAAAGVGWLLYKYVYKKGR